MTPHPVQTLPRGEITEQADIQSLLAAMHERGQRLDAVLDELASWSESVGYFDHLTASNEYLQFDSATLHVLLRLQINYSRLSYKAPEGERAVACPLCIENIGTPGKERLRVFEFALAGTGYFAHLTPFPLHPGHFVVNAREHEPMRIGEQSLREAAAFLHGAPGWLVASNSDVEWAGASVLGHHHMQVFRQLALPVEDAPGQPVRWSGGFEAELLEWFGPVARLRGPEEELLVAATRIVESWKAIDPGQCTCNYLMRRTDNARLALHLFFRHPDFRTPEEWRFVKSEGVGIIEMAGEIIVPPLSGRTRPENAAWFRENGPEIIPAIIAGNSPRGGRFPRELFLELLGRQ